jgi:hypothetical protein
MVWKCAFIASPQATVSKHANPPARRQLIVSQGEREPISRVVRIAFAQRAVKFLPLDRHAPRRLNRQA